jgi:hypothetical protein
MPSATKTPFNNGFQKLAKKTNVCFNPDGFTDAEARP